MSTVQSAGLWIAAVLAWIIVRLLGRSYRIEILRSDLLSQLKEKGDPVLLAFWHNRSFCLAYFLYQKVHREGLPITLWASLSRDGELVTRVGRLLGVRAVRGSSSRGGAQALRQLYRAVVKDRLSPNMVPDGPRGPSFHCKPGVITLAQMAKAPIFPISCAAERAWRLRSWDRMIIPRPFSRVVIAFGEPWHVPRGIPPEELADERARVESVLNELGERAHAGLGQTAGVTEADGLGNQHREEKTI